MSTALQENATHFQGCEEEVDHPFVMVPRNILRNPNLSPECKWFISYLLSHTGKWRVSIPFVIKTQKISKNRIYPIINEAIEAGYLKRDVYLVEGKKRFQYTVSREPKFKKSLLCPQNQDTENQDTENEDAKLNQSSSYEEEKKEQYKERSASPPASAEASALSEFFLSKIRERNKDFKEPNMKKWASEMDCIFRIDKRNPQECKKLIEWASTHKWWKTGCLSPAKLRKEFDVMSMQMEGDKEKETIRKNRIFALELKDKNFEQMKGLSFDDKYAINRASGREIPFSLPQETFQEALVSMFGGRYA